MRVVKPFDEFLHQGIAKRMSVDKERAQSLIRESERKRIALKERLEKIGISADNANDYVESCYDSIMMIIRSKLYLDGYACSGQGAHEAEVSYTRNLGLTENEVLFLDEMRYFRNGMLYYGTLLEKEYAERVISLSNKFYPRLKQAITETFITHRNHR